MNRQCVSGTCTIHGPNGVGEYSEVFERFVPAFFAGASVELPSPRTMQTGPARVLLSCFTAHCRV